VTPTFRPMCARCVASKLQHYSVAEVTVLGLSGCLTQSGGDGTGPVPPEYLI
jgi:hypothetical protein